MSPRTGIAALCAALLPTMFGGCANAAPTLAPVPSIELSRFMGDWYVIANIPTSVEKDAFNAIETYALAPDGRIQTTYQQRRGGFDSPLKTMRPIGTVRPGYGNALWGMQFIWPIKAEYVIAYVDADYTQTIVGRSKRDYAWIMARTPTIPAAEYQRLKDRLVAMGYSLEGLREVPQRWPETGPTPRVKSAAQGK